MSKALTILAGLACALFSAIAVVSAIRRDGAASLVSFAFAYVMYDVARGFIKEDKVK